MTGELDGRRPDRGSVACGLIATAATLAIAGGVVVMLHGWPTPSGAAETLTVTRLRPDGRAGGGGSTLLAHGRVPAFGSIETTRVRGRPRVRLSGVIPDGIASVRILERDGPRARRARPTTVAVRDNVFDVLLPGRMGPRLTVEWRTPDGRVVRRVHPRY